ncbi:unnamed protein product, partial [Amoebophrya sp. A25]
AATTITNVVGSPYLDFTRGLALLSVELAFLNYPLSAEKIQHGLGGKSLLCQAMIATAAADRVMINASPADSSPGGTGGRSGGTLDEASLPGIDEQLTAFFNKVTAAETSGDFVPEYLELARGPCEELNKLGHSLGLPMFVLCVSRTKLPAMQPANSSLDALSAMVQALSADEKAYIETIQNRLEAVPQIQAVRRALYEQSKELASYGFFLRALPHHALKWEDDDAEKTE